MEKQTKTQNQKKSNSGFMKGIKILTIILVVALISMVGFVGVFVQNKNQVSNVVKDYEYSMALNGGRVAKLEVKEESNDSSSEDSKKDTNKKETEKKEESVKPTTENFKNSEAIIKERLKALGIEEYAIRLDESNGNIQIELPEAADTDSVVSSVSQIGKFEILDSDTQEVLLNNDDIESSKVFYNNSESGTSVYLQIKFNNDGTSKFQSITETYVPVNETNSTENTTSNETTENNTTNENKTSEDSSSESEKEKKITLKIDDEEIMSTSFDRVVKNGELNLTVGSATTDTETLKTYVSEAENLATVLDNGKLEANYEITSNEYVLSSITKQCLMYVGIVIAAIACAGIIILVARFKLNGLLAGLGFIGFAAAYLLVLRYTNVVISIETIASGIVMLCLNYLFIWMFLRNIDNNLKEGKEAPVNKATSETYKRFFLNVLPIIALVIALSFVKWIPINSFAMTGFWGFVLIAIYNAIVTRTMIGIKQN